MLDALCIRFLQSGWIATISATFGVLILAFCLAFCWYQWKMIRKFRHIPSKRLDIEWMLPILLGRYPKDVPYTNVCFQAVLNAAKTFREEGLCMLWFIQPNLFVFNEEIIKDLVNESSLVDKPYPYHINRLIFGNGLLVSKHEIWKVQRKLLNPAFNLVNLKRKMNSLNKYALQLVEKLDILVEKPTDDVWELLKYSTFQHIADFVAGLEMDNESDVSLAANFMKLVDSGSVMFIERISRPWLYWDFMLPFFQSGKHYLKVIDEANDLVKEVRAMIMKKTAVSNKEQGNEDQGGDVSQEMSSIGHILLRLEQQHPIFNEKDFRDHIITIASAGYDTTAVTMLWCFYTLGQHLEVQEKAYKELQSVVPEGDVTYEDLAKLKYLECVIKETLRLYPSVPVIGRKASKDIQCGKYNIPKGTEVFILIFMLHRDPNIFPEPEKFDPERFLDGSKLRPWMYIPFAEGYRSCIGKKYTMLEMKVSLAHILRRFRITSLNRIDDSELDWTIVMKPIKTLQFLLENR